MRHTAIAPVVSPTFAYRFLTVANRDAFHRAAVRVSQTLGSAKAFAIAVAVVVLWLLTGPLFRYSDTWQLIINTSTTIVTFLMVFLLQNTQNRDARALHLKLDELIRADRRARNQLIDLEDLSDEELSALEHDFRNVKRTRQSSRSPAISSSPPNSS